MVTNSIKRTVNANKPGGRITSQLFNELTKNFTEIFEKSLEVLCANAGQKFSERQAYGILSQSLCKEENKKPTFILTEFPVKRKNKKEKTPGRVDFLISIRGQYLAIELKLVSRGLIGNRKDGSKKLQNAWHSRGGDDKDSGVVDQLNALDFRTSIFKNLNNTKTSKKNLFPKKFPILIVCYQRSHKTDNGNPLVDENITLNEAHKVVLDKLSSRKNEQPVYHALCPISPKPRMTKANDRSVSIYGLGFFAGTRQFEREKIPKVPKSII